MGVALGVQEERFSKVSWVHVTHYNNSELVSAVTRVANTLLHTI